MPCTAMSDRYVIHRYVMYRYVIHRYASEQSIWASQGRAAEGVCTMVVRVVLVGIP